MVEKLTNYDFNFVSFLNILIGHSEIITILQSKTFNLQKLQEIFFCHSEFYLTE